MISIPGCLLRVLSGVNASGLVCFECVPTINILLAGGHSQLLSSRNLMDRDVRDSFILSHLMKQPGTVIENLIHYTSFCVKCTNVLYDCDILVIT